MSRNLTAPMIQGITAVNVSLCFLVDLTLTTGVTHIWSGVGSVSYNGNTYVGVGSLGSIGDITEGTDVKAQGTSIALSGIDPSLMADSLNDIQLAAPCTIWLATFSGGTITAAYQLYVGTVDRPVMPIGPKSMQISLALENMLLNLQRPNMRRYTSPDQRIYYPDDIGFHWVESLNDLALVWG